MIYLILCWEFFKIGLFAIGGGYAALPFLYDLSDRYGWFSYADLADMIAVSGSTPGPLGINMAAYVGYSVAGLPGGILASLVLILPSLIIAGSICLFLQRFHESKLVQGAFYGLRPAVAGLIGAIAITLLQMALYNGGSIGEGVWDNKSAMLLAVLLFAVFKFNKHPVVYIAVAAVAGMIFKF